MSAENYASAINEKVFDQRDGCSWTFCPCHNDDRPSLLVVDCPGGIIKVKCFGDCTKKEVTAALKALNLWPEFSKCIKVV